MRFLCCLLYIPTTHISIVLKRFRSWIWNSRLEPGFTFEFKSRTGSLLRNQNRLRTIENGCGGFIIVSKVFHLRQFIHIFTCVSLDDCDSEVKMKMNCQDFLLDTSCYTGSGFTFSRNAHTSIIKYSWLPFVGSSYTQRYAYVGNKIISVISNEMYRLSHEGRYQFYRLRTIS